MFKNILLVMLVGFLVASCNKKTIELADINTFDVTADSTMYTLGNKVTFNFEGKPAGITFYSGEIGKRYIYRNRTSAEGISRLVFTHALNTGTQENSLKVMLSFDFKGVVVGDSAATRANIAAATWSDITPAKVLNKTATATDTVDLSTYAKSGKMAFVAFKYTAQAGSVQNKWTITNLGITNSLPDNSVYTIGSLAASNTPIVNYGVTAFNPGWVAYTIANTYNWAITAGTSLVITGASTAAAATADAEAWTIMGGIDLTSVTPDVGVPVTNITTLPVPYQYVYPSTGRFDATFVATNNTIYTSDSVVKVLPVVVQ